MFSSWLKPKEATIEQLLAQRDTCLAASAEAHENALRVEELAVEDPGKHAKALAKARSDAQEAELHVELAGKVVFRRLFSIADAAAARLEAERDRLLGPVSTETKTKLNAAQARVYAIAKQLEAAKGQRDAIDLELMDIERASSDAYLRLQQLRRDRDAALQLDLNDEQHRKQLTRVAEGFEETNP